MKSAVTYLNKSIKMSLAAVHEKALLFHSLHKASDPLIIPNCHDALSARIFEKAGARALATTSGGISAVFGCKDGENLPKELSLAMIDRIVKSVDIPVSVDMEAGWGDSVQEICDNVEQLIKIGVVGINIEDAVPGQPDKVYSIDEQVEKIRAIKATATRLGVALFVNARSDVYLRGIGANEEERKADVMKRLQAFSEAGADGLFVPCIADLAVVKEFATSFSLPFNMLNITKGFKGRDTLIDLGVSRLTVGSLPLRYLAHQLIQQAPAYLNENDFNAFDSAFSYADMNNLWNK